MPVDILVRKVFGFFFLYEKVIKAVAQKYAHFNKYS